MANPAMIRSFQTIEHQTRTLYSLLLDFVFPPFCVSCKKIGQRICNSCSAAIPWIDSGHCLRCGLPLETDRAHGCIDPSRLQFIRSAAVFSGTVRKSLHALKYHADRSLAAHLVRLAHPHWIPPTWDFDALIPVPLGRLRQQRRGYNQSLLLSEALSRIVSIPVDPKSLRRIRETQTQVGLSISERRENVADAFYASGVRGKRLLLVDDVCTTGATLQSCADALRKEGAAGVGALTLARAILPACEVSKNNPTGGSE